MNYSQCLFYSPWHLGIYERLGRHCGRAWEAVSLTIWLKGMGKRCKLPSRAPAQNTFRALTMWWVLSDALTFHWFSKKWKTSYSTIYHTVCSHLKHTHLAINSTHVCNLLYSEHLQPASPIFGQSRDSIRPKDDGNKSWITLNHPPRTSVIQENYNIAICYYLKKVQNLREN